MKVKSFVCVFLALIMVLALAACSQTAPVGPVAALAVSSAAKTADGGQAASASVDEQLTIIFGSLSKLQQKSDSLQWYYTVTDLDHDGRLELVAAAQHPADRSTNLKVWELNEAMDALVECKVELEEDESFPDILSDSVDTYYDASTEVWSYMFYDNVVLSDSEVYTFKCSVSLADDVISYEAYAIEHTEIINGERKVSHLDTNGFAISPEAYNASGANFFAAAERSNTSFDWFKFEDLSMSRLADSYAVFTGDKEPPEVFPVPKPAALQGDAAPAASAAPVPTAVPVQAPKAEEKPKYLLITKNPTNENRKEGTTALFVACANIHDSLTWTLVAPNGGEYSVQSFRNNFPRASVTGEYSTTLSIDNVGLDMSDWGAYCTFYYNGQTARTSTAYLYVTKEKAPATPAPAADGGTDYGEVVNWTYDTVSVKVAMNTAYTIPRSVCDIRGELYVGAPAVVVWNGRTAAGVNVTYCSVEGSQPQAIVYGSMGATVYDTWSNVYRLLMYDGSTVQISASRCYLAAGVLEDGCSCIVYYIEPFSVDNIYQVDLYGVERAIPEPVHPNDTPEPAAPNYGEMNGRAYHDSAFYVYVELDNGDVVSVKGEVCEIEGDFVDGSRCTAFYVNSPSTDNIYRMIIYGA